MENDLFGELKVSQKVLNRKAKKEKLMHKMVNFQRFLLKQERGISDCVYMRDYLRTKYSAIYTEEACLSRQIQRAVIASYLRDLDMSRFTSFEERMEALRERIEKTSEIQQKIRSELKNGKPSAEQLEILNKIQEEYLEIEKTRTVVEPRSGIGNLCGLSILDIACGNEKRVELGFIPQFHAPWFGRVIHHLGANMVGIDELENNEKFETHATDLSVPGSLAHILGEKKFDIINIDHFLGNLDGGDTSRSTSPTLGQRLGYMDILGIKEDILLQAEELLHEGGLFLCETEVYAKIGGKLLKRASIYVDDGKLHLGMCEKNGKKCPSYVQISCVDDCLVH